MAFRSSSLADFGVGTTTTVPVPVPSGSQTDDIAVVAIYTTNNVTTSRSGWTELTATTYVSSGFKGLLRWYWKRLVSADLSGPWTFTHSGNGGGSTGWAGVWSGRDTSAAPFDFTTSNSVGNAGAAGPPSVNGTATAGSDLCFIICEYDGNTGISASSYTQPINNADGQHLFYADNTTAGSKTPVVSGAGTSNNSWWVTLAAIKQASAPEPVDGALPGAIAAAAASSSAGLFSATMGPMDGTAGMKAGAASSDWPTLESKSGTQHVRRIYDSGFSTSFDDAGSTGIDIVYSFKPDMSLLAAQDSATMAALSSLLDSITTDGRTIYICAWHEPENDYTTSGQIATYVAGWQAFADAVHDHGDTSIKTCWIMMSFSWLDSSAREPEDWYPGDDHVDAVGVDVYNEGSLHEPQRWDSWGLDLGDPYSGESLSPVGGGYVHGGFVPWVTQQGKPWGVCEWGSIRNIDVPATPDFVTGNDITDSRADWITGGADYIARKGAAFLCYFDTAGRDWAGTPTESWQLSNGPDDVDYDAWGTVTAKYDGTFATGGSEGLGFRASTSAQANTTTVSVTVPTETVAGDVGILFHDRGANETPTGPAGWTALNAATSASSLTGAVWVKVLEDTDRGATVTVTHASTGKGVLELLVYSGIDPDDPVDVAGIAGKTSATTQATPTVTATGDGGILIQHVAGKQSTGTQVWTAPSDVTVRETQTGTGSGAVTTVSGDTLPATYDAGSVAGETWTASVAGQAVVQAVVLNAAPVSALGAFPGTLATAAGSATAGAFAATQTGSFPGASATASSASPAGTWSATKTGTFPGDTATGSAAALIGSFAATATGSFAASTAEASATARAGAWTATTSAGFVGDLAAATAVAPAGGFTATSTGSFAGTVATAAANVAGGAFTAAGTGSFPPATATGSAAAIVGAFIAAGNATFPGAVAAADGHAIPGVMSIRADAAFLGALAEVQAASVLGSWSTVRDFPGSAAAATAGAIAGRFGPPVLEPLTILDLSGPAIRKGPSGPGVVKAPGIAGPGQSWTSTGPALAYAATGTGVAAVAKTTGPNLRDRANGPGVTNPPAAKGPGNHPAPAGPGTSHAATGVGA